MAETVLAGGRVYDCRSRKFRAADVHIEEARIGTLSEEYRGDAPSVDCSGLVISPGFIDCHGHSDDIPLIECDGGSKLFDGVTTEICGNCGWSMFPNDGKPRSCGYRGEYTIEAQNFSQYFEYIEEKGLPLNLAFLAGHGMLRNMVAGRENRSVDPEEMDTMCSLLTECLDQGCIGLSLGLIYPPGCFSDPGEITPLAEIIADRERILTAHIRNEGNTLIESIQEFIEPARHTGARIQVSHLKAMWPLNWHKIEKALELLNRSRREGIDVSADRYPYTASSTGLDAVLPKEWFEGGDKQTLAVLEDGEARDKLQKHLEEHYGPGMLSAIQFAHSGLPGFESYYGKRIPEIAEQRGEEPIDCYISLLMETELRASAVFHGMKEDNLSGIYAEPWVCVGSDSSYRSVKGITSEGIPHPRSYGTFSRFLSRYCNAENGLTLEEGLSRITSLPAERFRLQNRGYLEPGYAADITVFDPERIGDLATYENPHQYSEGIVHLFINGEHVIKDGKLTGVQAGKVLKSI